MTVKLIITSADSNQNVFTTNVNYINPNASDETLATFAARLNGLSSNTFIGVAKVTTEDITEALENNGQ